MMLRLRGRAVIICVRACTLWSVALGFEVPLAWSIYMCSHLIPSILIASVHNLEFFVLSSSFLRHCMQPKPHENVSWKNKMEHNTFHNCLHSKCTRSMMLLPNSDPCWRESWVLVLHKCCGCCGGQEWVLSGPRVHKISLPVRSCLLWADRIQHSTNRYYRHMPCVCCLCVYVRVCFVCALSMCALCALSVLCVCCVCVCFVCETLCVCARTCVQVPMIFTVHFMNLYCMVCDQNMQRQLANLHEL